MHVCNVLHTARWKWQDAQKIAIWAPSHNFVGAISSQLRWVSTIKNKSSAVAEMSDRLATIGVGWKWGGAALGVGYPLGPHLTQCGLDLGLPLYQVASSSIQPFGHNCRNAMLLHIGICLWTIFIPSLVVKTFTGCVHSVIARYQLNSSK